MSIQLNEIKKSYGTFEALRGVSLSVSSGELASFASESGSFFQIPLDLLPVRLKFGVSR